MRRKGPGGGSALTILGFLGSSIAFCNVPGDANVAYAQLLKAQDFL